jgi:3-oxoacyl-[acyl-carrier protein] reductase
MDLNLSGKTALVTGSSKGIGLMVAELLHTEGCCVALNGRNSIDLAAATARFSGAIGVVGDVTCADDARNVVSQVVKKFGRLDILVCNVGSGLSVPPGVETPDEWQRMLAFNLWSTINIVEAAKDALVASRGVIVCVSSICGLEVVSGAPITYSVSKAALNAYVRGMSRPLGKQGVRINAVAPGNILFEGSSWSIKMAQNPDAIHSMLEKNVALGRMGSPQDVADLILYLSSDRSGFATGGVWVLDGGQVCR